jgi:hypothetical protein
MSSRDIAADGPGEVASVGGGGEKYVTGVFQAGSLEEAFRSAWIKRLISHPYTYEDFLETVSCLVGTMTSVFEGPACEGFFEVPGRVGVEPSVGKAEAAADAAGEPVAGTVFRQDTARSDRTLPGVMGWTGEIPGGPAEGAVFPAAEGVRRAEGGRYFPGVPAGGVDGPSFGDLVSASAMILRRSILQGQKRPNRTG